MTEAEISKISTALTIINRPSYDKETIRLLVKDIVDQKHLEYIEKGLLLNDKSLIMHGLMGALSHYEAKKEKEIFEKRINSITQNH